MINYILQTILFQILFLAIYDFFLSKETFFTKNRWYLISTTIVSFILPLIKIPTFKKAVPQEFIIYLPEIVLSPERVIQKTTFYQSVDYVNILFWMGVGLFSILFLIKIVKIFSLIKRSEKQKNKDFTLVLVPNKTNAFSFFHFVFLGKNIPVSQHKKVIAHELVHSKHKHSLDLLFFELLKIIMWFNPMIFIYQKRITLLHEYISDDVVSKSDSKENYINHLLSNFFQVENIAFVNQFYKKSLIKKRIIMMTKKQSQKINQLKYLLLIPVLTSMLFYTSCNSDEIKNDSVFEVKKELQTIYRGTNEGLESSKGNKETYLDQYIGVKDPLNSTKISYDELSEGEKNEYDELYKKFIGKNEGNSDSRYSDFIDFKLFKMPNGRNTSAMIFNIEKMKHYYQNRVTKKINENGEEVTQVTETEDVSFMIIDKAPTFPGCEEGDKDCFSKMVQKHFGRNFDANLLNKLGLESGRKRVAIMFKIDKEGNVVNVQARAPHAEITKEVIRVMNSLPKMIPGEHKGEKVDVKFSIPFTLVVE